MENLTCVIDAHTLVENIHKIKDWVYNGSIRLYIPICVSEMVEQRYQAGLKAQEAPKDPQRKRSSYKTAARKDHPLFDLNPQIAREFLLRSQSDTNNGSVSFQQPQEQFTQWKEEEEQAMKVEQTPEERPTSFAQALLRKLNIAEEGEGSNGPKAPAKPRLVARDSAAPKSPWKYHKVPTISSKGVPEIMKPLLSCVLWRLHEYENNPLLPETCIMLTEDAKATEFMLKFKVPTADIGKLRQKIDWKQLDDDRDTFGLVEKEFAAKKREKVMAKLEPGNIKVNGATSVQDSENETNVEEIATVADLNENSQKAAKSGIMNGDSQTSVLHDFENSAAQTSQPEMEKINVLTQHLSDFNGQKLAPNVDIIVESSEKSEVKSQIESTSLDDGQPLSPSTRSESLSLQSMNQAAETEPSSMSIKGGQIADLPAIHVESSNDSDDEVVVFNPKSRRLSGTPKVSSEPSKPIEPTKPSTPITYLKALEIGLPKRPVSVPKNLVPVKPLEDPVFEQNNTKVDQPKGAAGSKSDQQGKIRETPSQDKTSNHHQRRNRAQRPLQQPFIIKSQSPRQTPAPSPVPAQIQQRPPPDLDPLVQTQIEKLLSSNTRDLSRVEEFIALQNQNFAASLNGQPDFLQGQNDDIPDAQNLSMNRSQDPPSAVQVPHQHQQSRQRPYPRQPHRFEQGSPKFQRQPRKQLPISYPTIIDPDDFDRSPIIQQSRVHTPNGNSNGINKHRMPDSPKNGGSSKITEPEVDFVLRSGAPRGSTRGKGKLWVP